MNKFALNLSRSVENISTERANRWAKNAKKAQQALIDKIDTRVDSLIEQLENHNDLSTLVHATTANEKTSFNSEAHMATIQSLKLQITEAKVELEIATETMDEMFAEAKENSIED